MCPKNALRLPAEMIYSSTGQPHARSTKALCAMAQWCPPAAYSAAKEPWCWLSSRGDSSKRWVGILLEKVMHVDMIDYFTAHHSGRWVGKKLAKFLRKSKIRMLMRPFRYPDSSQTTEWARRPNLRRDIEAARQGSNEVWASAPNPFKIRSGDWVWCSEAGTHTRAISASDRIPLHPYRAVHGHTLNTCQPAIRLCPPLLVSDWVSTRRVNRACCWRSPDHADLQLPLLHYHIRGVVQGGQPRGDEQGGTWGTCTLACAKDTSV